MHTCPCAVRVLVCVCVSVHSSEKMHLRGPGLRILLGHGTLIARSSRAAPHSTETLFKALKAQISAPRTSEYPESFAPCARSVSELLGSKKPCWTPPGGLSQCSHPSQATEEDSLGERMGYIWGWDVGGLCHQLQLWEDLGPCCPIPMVPSIQDI